MPKRFIDSDLWRSAEFVDSTPRQKLLLLYVITNCDCIGWFEESLRLVTASVGESKVFTAEEVTSLAIDIVEVEPGKFWIPSYCHFQYGELSENCKPHRKYLAELKRRNLPERVSKGYRKGFQTLQEEEKEKEEEQEQESGKGIPSTSELTAHAIDQAPPDAAREWCESIAMEFKAIWDERGWRTQGARDMRKVWQSRLTKMVHEEWRKTPATQKTNGKPAPDSFSPPSEALVPRLDLSK